MLDHPTPPSSAGRVKASKVENAFPTPPRGAHSDASFHLEGRISPAPGKFMTLQRAQSTPPDLTNDNCLRSLTRGTVGDLSDARNLEQAWSRLHLSKKRSQYFSDAFAYREPNNTAKDRVARDSVVLAEVKLNCCLESEQEFLIDLSFRLSEIYQRPASCVMVMVTTEVAMLIGGNSEPAYHLTVTALPSEIAATKNKRSTHLIQDFMQDSLDIKPSRGVLRFEAVAEENLATNGMTALQEIEQLERSSVEDEGILRAMSRQTRRSKKSPIPFASERGKAPTPDPKAATPSLFPFGADDTKASKSTDASGTGRKRVKRRRSILAFFRR